MAWSNTYDVTTPAGTDDPKQADDRMREIKAALQERLAVDHEFSKTANEVSALDTGEHTQITFNAARAAPGAVAAGKGVIYPKAVGGKTELFWMDEDENEIQLTNKGDLCISSGELVATANALIRRDTADASDTGSIAINGGGATGVTRGGEIAVYGDDHASKPGQVVLSPGYSAGTTPAIIDATTHLISNVVDPVGDQDAATKKYVNDREAVVIAGAGFLKISGETVFNAALTAANTWQDLDLSAKVGANSALVFLEIKGGGNVTFFMKPKGYGGTVANHTVGFYSSPASIDFEDATEYTYMTMITDSSGIVQIAAIDDETTITIKLIGYVK